MIADGVVGNAIELLLYLFLIGFYFKFHPRFRLPREELVNDDGLRLKATGERWYLGHGRGLYDPAHER